MAGRCRVSRRTATTPSTTALRPGDDIIDAWINRMLLPDQVIEIDMDAITEPLLACPNDPDDVKPLSARGANVFLSSAELAAIAALLGKLPSVEEYMAYASKIDSMAPEIYRYLNFDRMPDFTAAAEQGKRIAVELKVA